MLANDTLYGCLLDYIQINLKVNCILLSETQYGIDPYICAVGRRRRISRIVEYPRTRIIEREEPTRRDARGQKNCLYGRLRAEKRGVRLICTSRSSRFNLGN